LEGSIEKIFNLVPDLHHLQTPIEYINKAICNKQIMKRKSGYAM
jgi:hypothetical protein